MARLLPWWRASTVVVLFLAAAASVAGATDGDADGAATAPTAAKRNLAASGVLDNPGGPVFLEGTALRSLDTSSLGAVGDGTGGGLRRSSFGIDAATALVDILKRHRGGSGNERFRLRRRRGDIVPDDRGHKHVRLAQTYEGLPVVDAAMMMHIDKTGQVYSVNGEFVADGSVDMEERFTCQEAFRGTLKDPAYGEDAVWLSDCALKIVLDTAGIAHKAWERMIGYTPESGPYQVTNLYASVVTGKIVTYRPLVMGALALSTRNCKTSTSISNCGVVTNGTKTALLNSSDKPINMAHNYAIATYKFYKEKFGRDSIDGKGMTMVSNVHVGKKYNNAYWTDQYKSVNYGDGDGSVFSPLSLSADVVGHEFTHGITSVTSGLAYLEESGALNEAMSDIFGACIDRYVGASIKNTFLIGEVVYTPNKAGDALRSMTNPAQEGDYDYYPDRYTGSSDNGGVHWNSGIMNVAFSTSVLGGTHPRNKTNIIVPAIDPDFDKSLDAAAKIWYMANIACLTPLSGFYEAYRCTLLHAGNYSASIEAAWNMVGVTSNALTSGQPITLSVAQNKVARYVYSNLPAGAKLSCTVKGSNGDADLYMSAIGDKRYTCRSTTASSYEACTVGPVDTILDISVQIHAYSSFTDAVLKCTQS